MEKIIKITSNPRISLDSVSSKSILKTFGRPEDRIELFIYDLQNNILDYDYNFTEYKETSPSNTEDTTVGEDISLLIDPVPLLKRRGYVNGRYKIVLNFQRTKIFKTNSDPFVVKEISSTRKEIRLISPKIKNGLFRTAIKNLISEIESSPYFKDLVLNFSDNINISGINFMLNTNSSKYELLVKTLKPIPSDVSHQSSCKLIESIIDPVSIEVDLGEPQPEDDTILLRGPNFNLKVRDNKSIPSDYKNYDQILDYTISSSYNNLVNILEKDEVLEVKYDYIRPVSESLEAVDIPFHFENFIHFGSAEKRLKNFKHKLESIELFNKKIGDLETISSPTASAVLQNRISLNKDIDNITKGFDGYERFLYYTTGSNIFTWPKQSEINDTGKPPYIPYSVSSSEAKVWLGHEVDTFANYGGQLLSASLFDRQNNHRLKNTVPTHIRDNKTSDFYIDFIDMIGQHFDQIWLHIKHITKTKDTHHTMGISKNLVYHALQSLGINSFDQFENIDLTEYILGEGSGSNQYDVKNYLNKSGSGVIPTETMVTASNEGSIAKQDITKQIWKRIYHNVPYLCKTKGTERGLRALMNCYGVPSTTLNIKEYGGSTSDKTTYKTFSYEKAGLALKGNSGTTTGHFIKTDWSASINSNQYTEKTVTFRIKPTRLDQSTKYHLFSLSGSKDFGGSITDEKDNHLILEPWGSINTDISSSGDHDQYGRLSYYQGNTLKTSTSYFPIFNGGFWNIFVKAENIEGNQTEGSASFGAYQANSLKNVSYYTAETTTLENAKSTWGWYNVASPDRGAREVFFGGVPTNESSDYDTVGGLMYSGSMQEIRYYFGEALSHDTLKKQALEPHMYAGNSISSSYDHLILRLPLGSNLHENTSSFHPNIDVDYINSGSISSSLADPLWENTTETHHLPTPDTVGASMSSEKVRIDTGTINDNILQPFTKGETSTLDRQPPDFEDLGIFLSPTSELNEDIIYTLGAFRLDDYIGSPLPSSQTSSYYSDLKELRDLYFKKVERKYDYWDYLKTIQYIDHTLFKVIEQFVPFRANTKTGLLIEPHYLERNKFKRQLPVQTYGQTAVPGSYNTFHLDFSTFSGSEDKYKGSSILSLDTAVGGGNTTYKNNRGIPTHNSFTVYGTGTDDRGYRTEFGTNATINLHDWAPIEQDAAQAPIKPFGGLQNRNADAEELADSAHVTTTGQNIPNIDGGCISANCDPNFVVFGADPGVDLVDPFVPAALMISGRTYIASAEIKNYVGGGGPSDTIGFSDSGGIGAAVGAGRLNGNGTISHVFISNGAKINVFAENNISGKMDNISVKEYWHYIHTKPKSYRKYTSNVLMGNIQKGRISTRYYRSLAIGNQNDILNNN